MVFVIELLKILLPAALVLWAMYLSIVTFLEKELVKKQLDTKAENIKKVIPLRLQAYERMILFLERISLDNFLVRLTEANSVAELHLLLLAEIRNEFTHNISQQLYISEEVWEKIKQAMHETIALINLSAERCVAEEPAIVLSKKIIENFVSQEENYVREAIKALKEEFNKELS